MLLRACCALLSSVIVRRDDLECIAPAGLGSPGAGSGRSGHNAWRHGGAGPGEGDEEIRRNTKT